MGTVNLVGLPGSWDDRRVGLGGGGGWVDGRRSGMSGIRQKPAVARSCRVWAIVCVLFGVGLLL